MPASLASQTGELHPLHQKTSTKKSNNDQPTALVTPSTPVTLPIPVMHKSWHLQAELTTVKFNTPDFIYGVCSKSNNQPKFQFATSGHAIQPKITLERYFQNKIFMPELFGNQISLKTSFSHLQTSNSDFIANPGTGFFWGIDGQSLAVTEDVGLKNASFNSKQEVTTARIILSGEHSLAITQDVYASPSMGFVYHNLSQDYRFAALGTSPIPPQHSLDEQIRTDYYGLLLADKVSWLMNSHWEPFIAGNASLLYANAGFSGKQVTAIPELPSIVEYINDSDQKTTYSAGITTGINFKPNTKLIMTASLGADYFAFVPEVVNPLFANTVPAHIEGMGEWNYFANLSLTVPF